MDVRTTGKFVAHVAILSVAVAAWRLSVLMKVLDCCSMPAVLAVWSLGRWWVIKLTLTLQLPLGAQSPQLKLLELSACT
jgi:hypothetical protein